MLSSNLSYPQIVITLYLYLYIQTSQSPRMQYGQNQYGKIPQIIQKYVPYFKQEQHLPTKHDTVLDSILKDHTISILNIGEKVIKGAAIGVALSLVGYFVEPADPKVLTNRVTFQKIYYLRKWRRNAVFGGIAGFAWYFLYDLLLCPHGHATFAKHLLAYSIAGSALWMIFWHPASFVFGGVAGLVFGLKQNAFTKYPLPPGFQLQFVNFDKKQREKAKRDQQQLELSTKLVKNIKSLEHNRYVF